MESREQLRSELTGAIQKVSDQIEASSIGSMRRVLVIRELRNTLAELRQALADLDAEDAKGS